MKIYLLLFGVLTASMMQVIPLHPSLQLYIFFFILLITGVPHGSLDYFVEAQSMKQARQKLSLKFFLLKYFLNMLGYGIIWFFFPSFALIIFIILTAYHFGEIDWPNRRKSILDTSLYTIYGLGVILFIISSHIKETAPILETIVRKEISAEFWFKLGPLLFYGSLITLVLHAFILVFLRNKLSWSYQTLLNFIGQSIVLLSIVYVLPFYLAFSFYFGLWHSLLSFNLIRKQMNLSDTWSGWIQLTRKALPFTLLAWIGLVLLIILSNQIDSHVVVITNLFVGIAVLTLPHLQVFSKIRI
jgi:Brp/Blh family beta-carotene 15,15'-monooxygenase